MSKLKVELDRAGVRELLRSEELLACCKQLADGVCARCGAGYEVTTMTGKNRVNAQIAAATGAAVRDNMENNTILKAMR